jgi:hypothetical protein
LKKYFGKEDPMGKVLNLSQWDDDFTVTGVIENIPMNSHLRFDIMGRIEFLGEDRLANLIAWPVSYFVMSKWLQDFAYKISIGPLVFVLGAVLSLAVALLTVSYHSVKIALSNPADLLRYE